MLQACMFVEPAGSCLVSAAPFEPAGCMARRFRAGGRAGEQSPDLADGERDKTGVSGRRGVRPAGGGAWASVRSRNAAAVTAQTARAAMTSTMCRSIAV